MNSTIDNSINTTRPSDTSTCSNCVDIRFDSIEQVLSVFTLLINMFAVILICHWLYLLWVALKNKRLAAAIKVRRPIYIIISYIGICPWLLEEGIANVYLFCSDQDPANASFHSTGDPVYFTPFLDILLHFGFWFGFWFWIQLKIFKLWMLRYDYEYTNELSNLEWREHLGLKSVKGASFFIRYRGWLGNSLLMFFLNLVILATIVFIQALIRVVVFGQFVQQERENAVFAEQVWIGCVVLVELIFVLWLVIKVRTHEDNFHLKPETKREFFVFMSASSIYLFLGLWTISENPPRYIVQRLLQTLIMTPLFTVFCYFETVWVFLRLRKEFSKVNKSNRLRLTQVLSNQEGFEAMMRYLVKEFSCENLLCYVELSQYLSQWRPKKKNPTLPLGFNASLTEETAVALRNGHFSGSSLQVHTEEHQQIVGHVPQPSGSILEMAAEMRVENTACVNSFPYFEEPEFDDELGHYEYLMQKYIYDSACLQINISHSLRSRVVTQSPGQSTIDLYGMIDDIRNDLWRLMGDSFGRFRLTNEFTKLCATINVKMKKDRTHTNADADAAVNDSKDKATIESQTQSEFVVNISVKNESGHEQKTDADDLLRQKQLEFERIQRQQEQLQKQILANSSLPNEYMGQQMVQYELEQQQQVFEQYSAIHQTQTLPKNVGPLGNYSEQLQDFSNTNNNSNYEPQFSGSYNNNNNSYY